MTISSLQFELVLPCYNEAKSIRKLVERSAAAAESAGLTSDEFQLVLVDNGSTDETGIVLDELSRTTLGKWFKKVTVEINEGYGFGIYAGLLGTRAPFVGWSHADEQCDPEDALKALAVLKNKDSASTLVKGVRRGRNSKDVFVSRIFELFSRVFLGMRVYEINAQPKIFPRALLMSIGAPPKTFAFDLYVLYQAKKLGWEILTIPVNFPPRAHGLSRWASTFLGRYKTILGIVRYMWKLRLKEGRV